MMTTMMDVSVQVLVTYIAERLHYYFKEGSMEKLTSGVVVVLF